MFFFACQKKTLLIRTLENFDLIYQSIHLSCLNELYLFIRTQKLMQFLFLFIYRWNKKSGKILKLNNLMVQWRMNSLLYISNTHPVPVQSQLHHPFESINIVTIRFDHFLYDIARMYFNCYQSNNLRPLHFRQICSNNFGKLFQHMDLGFNWKRMLPRHVICSVVSLLTVTCFFFKLFSGFLSPRALTCPRAFVQSVVHCIWLVVMQSWVKERDTDSTKIANMLRTNELEQFYSYLARPILNPFITFVETFLESTSAVS